MLFGIILDIPRRFHSDAIRSVFFFVFLRFRFGGITLKGVWMELNGQTMPDANGTKFEFEEAGDTFDVTAYVF